MFGLACKIHVKKYVILLTTTRDFDAEVIRRIPVANCDDTIASTTRKMESIRLDPTC